MISLRVCLSITFMIVIFTSFSNVLSSNYVLANNFTLNKQANDNETGQHNISYNLFSDLSRNFTSTNDSASVSATASAGPGGASASAGPGGASASAGGITANSP